MRVSVLIAVLMLSVCAWAQGGFYQDRAEGRLINGNTLVAIPGASVTVCSDQACVSPVTIYSDAALTQSITSLVADANGNFSFYVRPGQYFCQVAASGFSTAINPCQISVTMPTIASILFVDGSKYANIAAAVAAAGVNPTLIIIPSNYIGTECPAATTATITFWDLRGGSETCTQNSVSWNQTSGSGLHSMARFVQTRTSPSSSDTGVYSQAFFGGTFPANQTLSGGACEADTFGAITVGSGVTFEGCEIDLVFNSTGGTIPSTWGLLIAPASLVGNTTNLTTFANLRLRAYQKGGSETITNLFDVYFDKPTAGVNNYIFYAQGPPLFASDATSSGLNFEDSALAAHPVLTALSASNQMRFRPLLDSAGFDFTNSASSLEWLILNSSAVSVPSLDLTLGKGITADGGGFKHLRGTTGCTTAASVGAACTTVVTWATAFPDANYTATCTGDLITSGVPVNGGLTAKSASAVTFQTVAATASAAKFTAIDCTGVHD